MESIVFLGFSLYAWITIVTVLGMFTVLLFTKLRTDLVFLAAIAILFVTGVLDAKEAFSGFSSTSVVVIGVLFVVVAGLTYTGVLQWIVRNLLGQPDSYGKAVVRLMLPVAALSSFLSNTTVVSLFVGIVKMWSKKLGISPSKLLIPLSYASGMGGICTLIGTPPNLIISGLYADNKVIVRVTDGRLRIGIRKTVEVESDWTIFDHFRLLYYKNSDPSSVSAPHSTENGIATDIYDLTGRRLSSIPQRGVVIRNGQKLLVR